MSRTTLIVLLAVFTVLLAACDSGASTEADGLLPNVQQISVRLSACQGSDPAAWAALVALDRRTFDETRRACLERSTDCPAVLGCLGVDSTAECDYLNDSPRCVGGEVVETCTAFPNGLMRLMETDCRQDSDGNVLCVDPGGSGNPRCGAGTCDGAGTSCEGAIAVTCTDGTLVRTDCSRMGQGFTCQDSIGCVAFQDGMPCAPACDGTLVRTCVPPVTADCANIGPAFTCTSALDEAGDQKFGCGPAGSRQECEGIDAKCDGPILESCLLGVRVSIDCSIFGGGSCEGSRCRVAGWP